LSARLLDESQGTPVCRFQMGLAERFDEAK
jgi:hypothetical protein